MIDGRYRTSLEFVNVSKGLDYLPINLFSTAVGQL